MVDNRKIKVGKTYRIPGGSRLGTDTVTIVSTISVDGPGLDMRGNYEKFVLFIGSDQMLYNHDGVGIDPFPLNGYVPTSRRLTDEVISEMKD